MIIRCDKCGGAFEAAEGVFLGEKGARFRCVRCDSLFAVYPTAHDAPGRPGAAVRLRRRLILAALLLLILSLGFTATLTLTTLEKLYVDSLVSKYRLIGRDLQRNVEKSLRFGKPIHNFVGMDEMLRETKENFVALKGGEAAVNNVSVSVALLDGSVLYSTDDALGGTRLPDMVQHRLTERVDPEAGNGKAVETDYVRQGDAYFIFLPLKSGYRNTQVGAVLLSFPRGQVEALLDHVLAKSVRIIFLILGAGCVMLLLTIYFWMPRWFRTDRFPRFKISVLLFVIISMCQMAFTALNTQSFRSYYLEINREKALILSRMLKDDIEYFLNLGRSMDKLVGLDRLVMDIIDATPEIDSIILFDDDGRPLLIAAQDGTADFREVMADRPRLAHGFTAPFDADYNLRMEIFKEGKVAGYVTAGISEGYVSTTLSRDVVASRLRKILLDSVTVLAISLLFFFEMLILVFQFIYRESSLRSKTAGVHYIVARPAAFLFLFGIDICLSFIPLHMADLYEPVFGLSRDMAMGLPISMEMLFAGASTFLAGAWLDRRGWREPFLTGLLMAGLGTLYSWLSPDALQFILSRGIVGIGYGLCIMSSQGFIFAATDEKNKAHGLSQLFAGIFAGSICGGAAGAMLAERLGYGPVFLVGAFVILLVAPYALWFMRGATGRPAVDAAAAPTERFSIGALFRFLFSRNIASLVLFSSIPASVAVVGFINYFSPIYLKGIGTSQSDIGRVLMIYGICLIYVAPLISRYFDAADNKKAYIGLGGAIGSLAFLIFHFFGGAAATAAAIFLLGLSGSFGSARRAYALKQPATRRLGPGVAMGIYNSAGRLGQVAGPMIFGAVFVLGVDQGLIYVGGAYLIITFLFLILAQSDRKVARADIGGR